MKNNKLYSNVFMWMALGLIVTFATGMFVSTQEQMLLNIYSTFGYIIFVIIELALVIFLSARIMKLKPSTAKICFLLYSFVSGLTFSSIFYYYSLESILIVFLISAAIFAIMALIGYTTKLDLSKWGIYLFVGLIAVIITSIVNIFLNLGPLALIISIICIVLFMGITAYDMQKIKNLERYGLPLENLAIYGALELYLDFINIFIRILSIFGKERD